MIEIKLPKIVINKKIIIQNKFHLKLNDPKAQLIKDRAIQFENNFKI